MDRQTSRKILDYRGELRFLKHAISGCWADDEVNRVIELFVWVRASIRNPSMDSKCLFLDVAIPVQLCFMISGRLIL